jgi:hypothetical protein
MSSPETSSEGPIIAVPNFREDERVRARYASMLERRIKDQFAEHENSIRRNASDKRDELRAELDAAQTEWAKLRAIADAARVSYRAKYPQHVKKTRLIEPTLVENVRSLGLANKLYRAAEEAWRTAERAASDLRRIEHNDEHLEAELEKALGRAPEISKDVTTSEKWLDEIHAKEELGGMKAKVEAIQAERDAYAERLATGMVGPEELRLRSFAEQNIKPMQTPVAGMMFYRFEKYGDEAYFIVRDIRKQLYALAYDRRLEPIIGGVYDVVRAGKDVEVRRTTRENSPIPMSLLDHFVRCSEKDDAAAQEAYRQYQELVKQPRSFSTHAPFDETEGQVIELLAKLAEEKAR